MLGSCCCDPQRRAPALLFGTARQRQQPRRHRTLAPPPAAAPRPPPLPGGSSNGGGGEQPFDDRTRRALREAAEVLSEAQELAARQARQELLSSWAADAPGAERGSQAGDEGGDGGGPSSPAQLQAFWTEQGLSARQSQQLLELLQRDERFAPLLSVGRLSSKLESLSRVLPAADGAAAPVAEMVLQEPELLLASSSQLVDALVALVAGLPGRDVLGMAARRPSLLLSGDMEARLRRVVAKLVRLHPSHSESVVAGVLEENPELLLRMDYYLGDDVMLLDDLPVEIQNMMVIGDETGIGFLYKYWNNRLTEPSSSQEWEGGSGSEGAA